MTCVFIIFPLSLTPKMTGLRYISILSVGSMVYIILVLIAEFPAYFRHYNDYTVTAADATATVPVGTVLSVNYFNFDFKFFNAIGVIYFAYTN